MKRTFKDYALLFFKGMAMGAADVVPGVSGGTIAFITGIYEELIGSIRAIPESFFLLFKKGLKPAFEKANVPFFIALLSGLFISVITMAGIISKLLESYPIAVWSFFFGLIIASTWIVGKSIKKFDWQSILFFIPAAALAYYITIATPSETPNTYLFIFLAGFIAICAMILPGISGSFILLLLGKYQFIMQSIKNMDFIVILVFISGCLVGILSFARVVSFMFKKFHNATLAVLTGFMLGSLNKVWPWKEVLEYRVNSHGESKPFIEQSISPSTYTQLTGNDSMLFSAIAFALIGFLLVFVIELIANRKPKSF